MQVVLVLLPTHLLGHLLEVLLGVSIFRLLLLLDTDGLVSCGPLLSSPRWQQA